MKKAINAVQLFILIILTGCTLLTPPEISKPASSQLQKEPVKVLYREKDNLSLSVDVKHLLSLKNIEQVSEYVKVKDRQGNEITHLPVNDGQISVFIDFTPNLLELRYNEKDVPISIVVYHVCAILEKDVISNNIQSSFKKFNSVDGLLVKEITWNNSTYSWEFKFSSRIRNNHDVASLE